MDTNTDYDIVITTRFDGYCFPTKTINISKIDKNKVYVSSMRLPEYMIPDNFLIVPPNIYIKWFDIYKNMKNIINNVKIEMKLNSLDEELLFRPEELLFSSFLLCGYNIQDIKYIL